METKNNEQLKILASGDISTYILAPNFFFKVSDNAVGIRFPYPLETKDVVDISFTAQIDKQKSPDIEYKCRIIYGGPINSMTIPVATADGILPVQVEYDSNVIQFTNLLGGTSDNFYATGYISMTYHRNCTLIASPTQVTNNETNNK